MSTWNCIACKRTRVTFIRISIFAFLLFCKCIIRTVSTLFFFLVCSCYSWNLSTILGIINASDSIFALTTLCLCVCMCFVTLQVHLHIEFAYFFTVSYSTLGWSTTLIQISNTAKEIRNSNSNQLSGQFYLYACLHRLFVIP